MDATARLQHHLVGLRLLRRVGHRERGGRRLSVLGGTEGLRRADGPRGHVRQAGPRPGGGGPRR